MLDLLLGARKHRYLRSRPVDYLPAQVYVPGFSAGSYSGICLLHLLWNMPLVQVGGILGGIALPPALLHGIQPDHGAQLMVIHLTTDRLCQWHLRDETLSSLPCKFCIVDRSKTEGSILGPVSTLMDIGLISICHMADSPYGSSYANILK